MAFDSESYDVTPDKVNWYMYIKAAACVSTLHITGPSAYTRYVIRIP